MKALIECGELQCIDPELACLRKVDPHSDFVQLSQVHRSDLLPFRRGVVAMVTPYRLWGADKGPYVTTEDFYPENSPPPIYKVMIQPHAV